MQLRTRIGATAAATALVVFGFGGQAHAQIVDTTTTTTTTTTATPLATAAGAGTEVSPVAEPLPEPVVVTVADTFLEQGTNPVSPPTCKADAGSLLVDVPPQTVDFKLTTVAHPISDPINVSVPAGRYASIQGSFDDAHPNQEDQPNEAWFAVFYSTDGLAVATTTPTPDLPSSDVRQLWVGTPIVFTADAASVVYYHAPGGEGPDSVYPNCLKLTPLVEPKQPKQPDPKQPDPSQPDPKNPLPGGNDPDQPPKPPNPEPNNQPEPVFVIPVVQVVPDIPVAVTPPVTLVVGPPAPTPVAEPSATPAPSTQTITPAITPVVLGVDVVPDAVPTPTTVPATDPVPTPNPEPTPGPTPAPATVPEIARTGTEPGLLLLTSMDFVGVGALLVCATRRFGKHQKLSKLS
jgi:hypothetical protein